MSRHNNVWLDAASNLHLDSDNSIPGLVAKLRVLLECEPRESRLSCLAQLDNLLPDSAKVERACNLLEQVRRNRENVRTVDSDTHTSEARLLHPGYSGGNQSVMPPSLDSTSLNSNDYIASNTSNVQENLDDAIPQDPDAVERKRIVELMGHDAIQILGACFGPSVEDLEAGLVEVYNRKRTVLKLAMVSSEEVQTLQQEYTTVAAELMLRWNLTTRQYMEGRKLIVSSREPFAESQQRDITIVSTQEPGMVTTKKRKRKHKGLSLEQMSLAKRTAGIEFLPSLTHVNRVVEQVRDTISLPPKSVRERLPDGRFRWVKVPQQPRIVRRRNGGDAAGSSSRGIGNEAAPRSNDNQHEMSMPAQQQLMTRVDDLDHQTVLGDRQ